MQINRDLYLDKLVHAIGNQMIKVVTGMRRCGKSYLLFTILHDYLMVLFVAESHIIKCRIWKSLKRLCIWGLSSAILACLKRHFRYAKEPLLKHEKIHKLDFQK